MGCLAGDRASPDFTDTCTAAPLNVLNETTPDTVAMLDVPFSIPTWQDITPADREAANGM